MPNYAQAILDIVWNSTTHPTAEQIFLKLKESWPKVAQATVYNNLRSLTEGGKIRRIASSGGPDRYDKTVRHDHLMCCECGALLDIDLGDFTQAIETAFGAPIEEYDLKIRALCKDCREKKNSARSGA